MTRSFWSSILDVTAEVVLHPFGAVLLALALLLAAPMLAQTAGVELPRPANAASCPASPAGVGR